jgi:hypothetical protein
MIKGSCLCGKVQYVIDGKLGPISHCHCPSCRKAHAAAFSTVTRVNIDDFRLKSGEELLTAYESSPGKKRYFCSICSSQIYAYKEGESYCVLRLGTFDDDPGEKPIRHIFVSEKAPWYTIDEQIPQFQKWPT